jgi:hypothetical protein
LIGVRSDAGVDIAMKEYKMGRHTLKLGTMVAAAALLAVVSNAHADTITILGTGQSVGMTAPAGSSVFTFDQGGQTAPTTNGAAVAPEASVTVGSVTAAFTAVQGGVANGSVANTNTAPQTGASTSDTTNYMTVAANSQAGGSETITFTSGGPFSNLGLYIGSIDTWNTITFLGTSGTIATVTGTQLLDQFYGNTSSSGTGGNSQYVEFTDVTGQDITGITLTTTQAAFEVDNLSVANGVPEPATWAMMLIGFGLVGLQLRRRTVKEVTC